MDDLSKILVSAAAGFVLGLVAERLRDRRQEMRRVRDDYLKAVEDPAINDDAYLRFAALQKAGGWRLTFRQLKELAEDVRGRGLPDPFSAWAPGFAHQPDFPKGFLIWAKDNGVNLSDPTSALLRLAEQVDLSTIPKPPEPPGYGAMLI